MSAEIDLITLPGEEWREVLASASVLDLVHGGFFRARRDTVVFYAGPENAPDGWSGGFTEGTLESPRAAIGTAEVVHYEERADCFTIRLTVSNWRAARRVKQEFDRGDYGGRFQEYVMAQEAALRGRPEDRDWLRGQFELLRGHARGDLVSER